MHVNIHTYIYAHRALSMSKLSTSKTDEIPETNQGIITIPIEYTFALDPNLDYRSNVLDAFATAENTCTATDLSGASLLVSMLKLLERAHAKQVSL